MKSFVLMLTFLTRIPIKYKFNFEQEDFAKGLLWLPFIGVIIGLPLGLFANYVDLSNPYLMSFIYILIYISMTGGLHLDGLGDYFDAIFSGRGRERMLEIMKDSHIGTFGVVGLILYFVGFFALSIGAEPLVLFFMPVVGKTMAIVVCGLGRYPRESGMGQPLIDFGKKRHVVIYSLILISLLYFVGINYLVSGLVVICFTLIVHYRTTYLIGGVTGDVIGAVVEMSQILWLLSFAVIGGL